MRILHNPAVQTSSAPNADSEVDTATLSTIERGCMSTEREFSKLFSDIVCEQARRYMNSYPGNGALGCNTPYHARFEQLAQGYIQYEEAFGRCSDVLHYRMSMIKLATEMKNYLGLPIEDARLFDVLSWEARLVSGMHYKDITKEDSPWTRYKDIISMIRKACIFDSPVGNQGLFYPKPSEYLAAALYDSGRSMVQIASDIEKLEDLSLKRGNRPTEQ
ncbi:hypothetical protein V502_07010 [Pseudogymnoascus sp. VKM F-4520 (FW-2644)]|nr:hypothetical protein V502_07010 [Pseudogymnoascus sp. VKM F-4520 (FW-2644)]